MSEFYYNLYKQIPLEIIDELKQTSFKKGKSRELIRELAYMLRHITSSGNYEFQVNEYLFNVPLKEIVTRYNGLKQVFFVIQKDGETYFWKGYGYHPVGDVTFEDKDLRMNYHAYGLKKQVFKLQTDYHQINDPITGVIDAIASVPGNPTHAKLLAPYTQLLEQYQSYAPSLF